MNCQEYLQPEPPRFPWYGIRTRSNQEKLTATVLENKGFENFLPTYRVKRKWSDRLVETDVPLFPGYVFCRFEVKQRLPILTTPGVVSVLGFGSEPAAIADSEIEAIQAILESGFSAEPCDYLYEGQRVRVTSGALEGVEGVLLKKKNQWRMIVSVTILNRSISVEIDRDWIATA